VLNRKVKHNLTRKA